jgi:hypothetical protein
MGMPAGRQLSPYIYNYGKARDAPPLVHPKDLHNALLQSCKHVLVMDQTQGVCGSKGQVLVGSYKLPQEPRKYRPKAVAHMFLEAPSGNFTYAHLI